MDLNVPVQNRYDVLAGRENGGPDCFSNSNRTISRQDFVKSSLEDKMVHMFDELRFIRNEQVNFSMGINFVHQSVVQVNDKLTQVISTTNTQSELLKTLAYRSVDMEARARRNNLIFRGFVENVGENCYDLLLDFLKNRLDIESRCVYIARAHRLGQRDSRKHHQNRPIIANFRDFQNIELIMSKVRQLRNTPFSVDFDFPQEIQAARGRLWPLLKELRREHPRARIQIVYPAKLIKDGSLVRDELPDWHKYMRTNRLSHAEQIGDLRPQFLRRSNMPDHMSHMASMAATTDLHEVGNSNTNIGAGSLTATSGLSESTGPITAPSIGSSQHTSVNDLMPLNLTGTSGIQPSSSAHTLQRHDATFIVPQQNRPANGAFVSQQHTIPLPSRSSAPVNVPTLSASNPQVSETYNDVRIVGNKTQSNNSTIQLMNNAAVCTTNIDIVACAPDSICDETSVKSTDCDSGNPLLIDKLESRGRSRVARSESRSQRRTSSAVPYRRQANTSKSSAQRVLPYSKNSESGLSSAKNSTGARDGSTTRVVRSNTYPCETHDAKNSTGVQDDPSMCVDISDTHPCETPDAGSVIKS